MKHLMLFKYFFISPVFSGMRQQCHFPTNMSNFQLAAIILKIIMERWLMWDWRSHQFSSGLIETLSFWGYTEQTKLQHDDDSSLNSFSHLKLYVVHSWSGLSSLCSLPPDKKKNVLVFAGSPLASATFHMLINIWFFISHILSQCMIQRYGCVGETLTVYTADSAHMYRESYLTPVNEAFQTFQNRHENCVKLVWGKTVKTRRSLSRTAAHGSTKCFSRWSSDCRQWREK